MDIAESTENRLHSFARPELARVIHTNLKLKVDFKRRVLRGTAILTIERKPLVNELILDNYELDITEVTNVFTGSPLRFNNKLHNHIGCAFIIYLPQARGNDGECKIQIEYKTCRNSPSLYWLTPQQTADGLHPFLLSYNKLIYARAMFPCQDTPSVKFTYTAQISVLRKFTVLMSARLSKCNKNWEEAVYKFNQRKPVPSYAVIIAVGVFQKKVLNNRIHVFAENKFIDESFNTFYLGAIESMLKIAESLCGSYVWGRYDVCVLPPSIAHFKIECPCVAFISPALLRGDRSSISYSLTRNISQSWAGNLVTCAHYNDLWLNKSFSIFISRKIICKMSIHEEMMPFLRREEIINVYYMIEKCWQSGNADLLKCLVPDLLQKDLLSHKTIDFVPYEMGCTLLDCLEDMLGPSLFESFLLSYFNEFAYKSISTDDWKKYLYRYFSDKKKMLDSLRWYAWFRVIPLLPIVPRMTALHIECRKLAKEWVQWNETSSIPSIILERRSLCDVQRELLLQYLYSFHTGLTKRKLKLILDIYIFDNDNGQIRFNWLLLCIKARWFEKVTTALDFATEFCSPMIACPIFEHLYEWIEMRSRAIKTYNRHKGKMLTETREMLDKILHIN